jgi:hypothetical protein
VIEDRRYLIWSGTYFLAVVALAYSVTYLDFPVSETNMRDSLFFRVALASAGIFGIVTTLSGLVHMFTHRNCGWFVFTLFLVFVSAYLYGLLVVTKPNTNVA